MSTGAPWTVTRPPNGHGLPSAVSRIPSGLSGGRLLVAKTALGVVSPLTGSIMEVGIPPRMAISPAGAPATGAMLISVSSRLPHTGTWLGSLHGTATLHDRMARMRTILGPFLHAWRCSARFTGNRTA